MTKSIIILIVGPYRSGTNDNPDKMSKNLERLESAAWPIFEKCHVPIIGEIGHPADPAKWSEGACGNERCAAVI